MELEKRQPLVERRSATPGGAKNGMPQSLRRLRLGRAERRRRTVKQTAAWQWSLPVAAVDRSAKKREEVKMRKRDVGKMDSCFSSGVEAPLCPPL
jgi:hypothetical protein